LTNIVVDCLDENANEGSLNQLFIELFTQTGGLFNFCQSFPHVRMFLAPPNIRLRPNWYPKFRPTVIRVLHQFMLSRPQNLQLLQDFSGDLDKEGIHFSILCGINFVKSLADQTLELMKIDPPVPSIKLVFYFILIRGFRDLQDLIFFLGSHLGMCLFILILFY